MEYQLIQSNEIFITPMQAVQRIQYLLGEKITHVGLTDGQIKILCNHPKAHEVLGQHVQAIALKSSIKQYFELKNNGYLDPIIAPGCDSQEKIFQKKEFIDLCNKLELLLL